jgi:hypothetical protein
VSSPDGDEVWNPDELRRPNQAVTPLRHGRDLWWVSGDGGIAADGIKTGEEFYGLVVNLRDERRPQFTVDRNTLRAWDKEWVNEQVRNSLPNLAGWPGFSLSWLWRVADSMPAIAQQIYDYAIAIDHHLNVGEMWGKSTAVPIGAAGCLASDYQLFVEHHYRHYGRWFRAWRAGVWRNLVVVPIMATSIIEPFMATAQRPDGFPVPDSVDSDLLDRLDFYTEDGQPSAQWRCFKRAQRIIV